MIRKIIKIDQARCNGCGLCVDACHEGAIFLQDGKAMLLRDEYCDGLGDCLPACPQQAISFEKREALPYDEAAVLTKQQSELPSFLANFSQDSPCSQHGPPRAVPSAPGNAALSMLRQWPVQIQLVPVQATFFQGAHLLIAADCCAYACGSFHADFMRERVTLIACPKLDPIDYIEKMSAILQHNTIESLTLTRMSVPCCGGLAQALAKSLAASGKNIPYQIYILSPEGKILG